MTSKVFLYINAVVILFIIYKIIAGRKASRPTPLSIGDAKPPMIPGEKAEPVRASPEGRRSDFDKRNPGVERSLNCTFVFNGHTFDAFEVLGLPAGSSREACLRAAMDLKSRGPKQDEFFDALWAALEKKIL